MYVRRHVGDGPARFRVELDRAPTWVRILSRTTDKGPAAGS